MREEDLGAYLAAARAAWPTFGGIAGVEAGFAAYVIDQAKASPLPLAHAGDLYLAWACAQGVPGAAEAFHAAYGRVIARVLSRRRATPDVADDAAQTVHERLLVSDGASPPKIAQYTGRGPLKSWVSTTAATTVLMMHRAAGRRREDAEEGGEAERPAGGYAPDIAYMKAKYKSELEAAIVASLDRLGDRERTILRLHLGELLSIDRIGAMYKVDRSTAARWVASARKALIEGVRGEARARLRLSETECDSIAGLVQSELHVSVARLLGSS